MNNMDSSRELDKLKGKLPEDTDIFQGDPKRQDYLETKAMLLVHQKDPVKKNNKIAKVIQRIRSKERGCKMYQTFKTYLKAAQKAVLSYLDVSDYDET
eukprot:406032-Ditylum_brightwellii.AAC.2